MVEFGIKISTILIIFVMLGCDKKIDLRLNNKTPDNECAKIVIGEYISVRKIEKIVIDNTEIIFNDYIGQRDSVLLPPGKYLFTTKIEYSEGEQLGANKTGTTVIRSTGVDNIIVDLEAGQTYVVYNKILPRFNWKPEFRKIE